MHHSVDYTSVDVHLSLIRLSVAFYEIWANDDVPKRRFVVQTLGVNGAMSYIGGRE